MVWYRSWGVLVTVLIQSGQRKEFRVRLLLQRIKEKRIEQLTQEKEQ